MVGIEESDMEIGVKNNNIERLLGKYLYIYNILCMYIYEERERVYIIFFFWDLIFETEEWGREIVVNNNNIERLFRFVIHIYVYIYEDRERI